MTECGMLIRVQVMTGQLATCHTTNGVDKILTVEVFKPVLVWVVGVGVMVEIMSRGILDTVLVTSILWNS